jgi:16S rRNA processing protein RimM
MKIESSQIMSDRPLIKFVGVGNREQASRMTNRDMAVSRDDLIELEPDTHYVFDLVGCVVFDLESDKRLGEVIDVNRYPANDVYVVKTDGGKEVLYPAVRDLVAEIDIEAKKLVVRDASLFEVPEQKTKK